jgi:hypothetical protein
MLFFVDIIAYLGYACIVGFLLLRGGFVFWGGAA